MLEWNSDNNEIIVVILLIFNSIMFLIYYNNEQIVKYIFSVETFMRGAYNVTRTNFLVSYIFQQNHS